VRACSLLLFPHPNLVTTDQWDRASCGVGIYVLLKLSACSAALTCILSLSISLYCDDDERRRQRQMAQKAMRVACSINHLEWACLPAGHAWREVQYNISFVAT
jgi:hypothetical protein